jgi:uncharacterized protein Yka (UPF0111/DUF47 family)
MTHKPDLRDLARQIRFVAQTHPCWSQAHTAVAQLEEHLCAIAAVHELNHEVDELNHELDERAAAARAGATP